MLLSCKVSNTVLLSLEQRFEDLSSLLETVSLPEEFLRDPSYWMQAEEMENFLQQVLRLHWQNNEERLLQKIAHATPQLRSWGVLDSVLRMMPRPQEMWAQPARFLANFISPEPVIERIIREETGISFDLPISAEEFPLTSQFLTGAFETLPVFVGKEQAVCQWVGHRLKIRWESNQSSMFEGQEPVHSISPDLLKQVVASLETHSHELQQKNCELQARNEQLVRHQSELEAQVRQHKVFDPTTPLRALDFVAGDSALFLRQNLSRLTDSFVRAQQLVTLLVGQDRANPAVKEAMRRMDWDRVKSQFPKTVEESLALLENSMKEQDHV